MLNHENEGPFQWAVVGAGPAGIAAVGKLLDQGIAPADILWVDPHFKVGDLGQYWSSVSSNTKVKFFNDFLYDVSSFSYKSQEDQFSLSQLNPAETCTLSHIVQPLQWISDNLMQKVVTKRALIQQLNLSKKLWTLTAEGTTSTARNVVLATGAMPIGLNYPGADVIPFDVAIDKEALAQSIDINHTFAVFGSSHSAVIILRYLIDLGVKKVINFYRSPPRYAVDMGDWILFDNTGLKGHTATWSRENLDGINPPNLVRYNTSESNITRYLPECDKVIYAVGFEKRNDIVIGDYENAQHNPYLGIIGPGLFGFGIAYPELKADPFGNIESQVGLWKFMKYLNNVIPVWLKYST